jgi:hypothetical protein
VSFAGPNLVEDAIALGIGVPHVLGRSVQLVEFFWRRLTVATDPSAERVEPEPMPVNGLLGLPLTLVCVPGTVNRCLLIVVMFFIHDRVLKAVGS